MKGKFDIYDIGTRQNEWSASAPCSNKLIHTPNRKESLYSLSGGWSGHNCIKKSIQNDSEG